MIYVSVLVFQCMYLINKISVHFWKIAFPYFVEKVKSKFSKIWKNILLLWGFSGILPQKNPEVWGFPVPKVSPNILRVVTPSPSPKFGGSCPQSVPEHLKSCNPVPISKIWFFWGILPKETPKFRVSPSPKCPQTF